MAFRTMGAGYSRTFPPATGGRKFLLVAVDYFIKWIEAEPLAKIIEAKVQDFIWKSIICRFSLPHTLISDNGRQFYGSRLTEFCQDLGIIQNFTSVAHPQANGEAEVANRIILQGLKIRLDQAKGWWVDELYNVLWAYRTTHRTPTGETPFNLAYGVEAIVPLEVEYPSVRVENYDESTNSDQLRCNLRWTNLSG